ncbi:glycosyl hydrolase [uncultured Metabacillus sp.]|uniref:glycosyl hydrolase n=1 Tax=uncultured Metabacillus sp. TaxID=2860135 RepID=UPI00262832A3|nr:glycosyl hydrolase [uncultured Metabacillus sp.]
MVSVLHQQFLHPPEEFTPIPFWFWNDHLTKEEIIRQINDFYDKGVTGFVLHPRIGIPEVIVYLSDYFMELVHTAVEEAKRLGMLVILYDEAMYPSGSAKGLVVKDHPEYASRGLKMIEYPCDTENEITIDLSEGDSIVSAQAVKKQSAETVDLSTSQLLDYENGKVSFRPPDDDNWSILVFVETYSGGNIRGIHFGEDDGEENAPASADLLNPDAVAKFIQITHDRYYDRLKDYFGNTVIAMFTDEPDILGRGSTKGLKPWTRDFLTDYKQHGNKERHLASLWFHTGDETETHRINYSKAVNKRLTEAYYKQISDWCVSHGIALTGHPAKSSDIGLLDHFQIPGQDVVWRWVAPEDGKALEGEHSTAGKCSADAARHRGRRRNLNEFLGVCSKESPWALTPGDMKWYMDWLLVRGVNLLCPHAFYYSIEGERRSHERPPDVGPNNLWWPYYKPFAQYMKRLSWLMTDSVNQTSVAILCGEDHLPWKVAKPLFENQIEFNYLEEALFLLTSHLGDGKIEIVNQSYQTVIIENGLKLEADSIAKLEHFIQSGGEVIVLTGEHESSTVKGAKVIQSPDNVVDALSRIHREEVIISPACKDIRVSKIVKDGKLFYFFVNEGEENYKGSFSLKEVGRVEKWDAWTGEIEQVNLHRKNGKLVAPLNVERRSSIVFAVDIAQKPLIEEEVIPDFKTECIELDHNWIIDNRRNLVLGSWVQWEGMESYSGTVTYKNQFILEDMDSLTKIYLDLGEAYEIVKVTVNEHEIGVKMWAPYRFDVHPAYLVKGVNKLTVDVTNNRANEMDHARLMSGLLGPVSFEICRKK